MKNESRLNPRQQEEFVATTNTQAQSHEHLFTSPEDALRADRAATPLPPDVTHKIAASLAAEPRAPQTSWWKRLLGLRP